MIKFPKTFNKNVDLFDSSKKMNNCKNYPPLTKTLLKVTNEK